MVLRFEFPPGSVFHGRIGRRIHRSAKRVAGQVRGVPLAAALFEPNVVRAAGPGLMMLALPFDWRRQDRAIAAGLGLAPESLLVVTNEDVYAFDASLLRWTKILRKLGEWPRADLVARAVAVSGPVPPRWAETRFRPPPGLRLEDTAGLCLAEVRPLGWGDDAKEVFRLLTGSAGWPGAGGPA